MPYYSDIGTSGSAKSLLLSGPYANHSSIIASNYIPYSNTLPRQYRAGYKPQLTTISEFNSPLRRVDSPKLYHSSPKVVSIRPIKIIDTADIDVSVNRYRKFNKYERTKPEILDLKPVEKTPSPKTVQATEEKEAKPTTTIKRERATVRIKTVHEDTFKDEINEIKSWRDNFKEDELFETGGKRVRKSPGEILKEKFLIRSKSKENIAKLEPAPNNRRKSVSKSPSFRDICKAITTDDNIDDLNPGQPLEVQIKQSRQVSTEDIIKHIRRSSTQLSADDLNILDHILQKESEEPEPAHPGAKKKKAVRKKTGEILTSGDTVADSEQETEGRGTVKKKKVLKKGTSDESVVSGECKKTDADFDSRGSFKKKRDSSISKSSSKDTLLIDSSPVCDEIIDKCEEVGDIKQPEKHLDKSKDLKGNIVRLNKAPTKSDLIKDQSELKITTPIKVVSDISPKDKLLELSSKKDTLKQKVISKSDSSTSLPDKKIITSLNKSNSSQSLPEDKALDLLKKKADIAQDLSKKKTLFSKAESTTSLPDAKAKELDKSSSSKSLPDEKTNTSQLTKKSNEFSELSKDLPFLQQKPLVKKSANKEVTDKNKMTESIIAPKMPTVRDISQVDIEQTVFKPKPVITGTIGEIEEKKSPLKVVVDNVEIVESPKKKDKKFRFNLDVEVKAEPPKVKMPIENGTVELPAPKDPLVIGILKKKPLSLVGQVLEEKERTLRIKKVATKKETDSTVVGVEKCAQSDKKADSKVPLSPNDKEEPKGVIKRKLFVTKPSHSSTDSSAPPSPVTLASPFIKNDDVFAKRTIVVPRKKVDTEEPTEDQRGSRNKFVDNDDFARPLSPLRHDKEVLDHTTTEVMKDNTTAQQKSGTEEATPKKKVIKVVKKKNITPASSEDQDSVVVNGEAKIEKNNLTLKEGGKAIANGEVVKSSADGEVDDKAPKKEAVAKKEEEVSKDGVKGSEGVEAKPDAEVDERKTGIVKKEVEDTTGGGVNIKTVPLKDEPVVSSADKKLVSKRSLVQKADKDDPDLQVFVPPEPESKPEPEQKETFVPLQSNRLTQFMQPWKKPEQFDVCPVEIWAKPKVIRGRHYPRPRGHPAVQPHSDSEEDSESEEESTSSSSEDDSTSEEEEEECDGGTTKVAGASTSSVDSGFGSGAACKKESSDSRDSPSTSPLANNSEYSLDSECIPEEFSASSTYASFQKTGRITPPATTIPRFKKYSIDDFNFLKVLGKGSFGKVMLAELKGTEYYYAVKCLKKDVVLEDDDVECTLIERKVLALGTKHPYLCHLLCTFQTESHLFFVMEYLNGGDLMFHIQASGRFPEDDARFYGAEIVSGLKFLHTKGIVYRDLKLDNVLLDFDGHVRIADFGMCKLQIFLDRMAESFCGTPDYMAPEIIKGQHYNQCVDWWSFGVLLYEMLSGTSPFSGCDEDELFWSICNEKPVMPKYFSTYSKEILSQLLEKDASKRLGNRFSPHGDIQDHNFFKKIDWYALEKRQLEPPFKPNLQHPLDTQYFDKHFTVEKAKLTPIDGTILESIDQTQFQGFSYTNPNATDK